MLEFAVDPIALFVAVPVLGWLLLTWTCALVTTAVVWPMRMISGRWPVVAYPLSTSEDIVRPQRRVVHGRAEADAAAREWAADIERYGWPQVLAGR